MSVMPDSWIIEQSTINNMISPFCSKQISEDKGKKVLSYGISSYGYDVRLSEEFYLFSNVNSSIVDPKNFSFDNLDKSKVDKEKNFCIIPPNSCLLGRTIEYFRIPRDILVICVTKSTYARCGLIANVTPIEPEFEGQVVLEISNTTPVPVKVYFNEGICQFLFLKGHYPCSISYKDKEGKYMKQTGITVAKV